VQLYRSSLLCDLLTETLEELCEEAKVSEELAQKVLAVFDKSCLEALTQRAEAKGQLTVRIHCNMRAAQGPTPDRRLITKVCLHCLCNNQVACNMRCCDVCTACKQELHDYNCMQLNRS
jgi:Transcription initiation factor IIA, gamma subunit, helical domain